MKIERRPLTLIEVCIAFGIIAICFYMVFSNFHISAKLLAKTESTKLEVVRRQFLMQRLYKAFEHSFPVSLQLTENGVDEIKSSALSFTYENGLDREMIFSGKRQAEIELMGGALLLSTWSKDGAQVRQEVLIDHVKRADWNLDTPTAIRLTLVDDAGKSLDFAFICPRSEEEKLHLEKVL